MDEMEMDATTTALLFRDGYGALLSITSWVRPRKTQLRALLPADSTWSRPEDDPVDPPNGR